MQKSIYTSSRNERNQSSEEFGAEWKSCCFFRTFQGESKQRCPITNNWNWLPGKASVFVCAKTAANMPGQPTNRNYEFDQRRPNGANWASPIQQLNLSEMADLFAIQIMFLRISIPAWFSFEFPARFEITSIPVICCYWNVRWEVIGSYFPWKLRFLFRICSHLL